jgi:hypothetical protein
VSFRNHASVQWRLNPQEAACGVNRLLSSCS